MLIFSISSVSSQSVNNSKDLCGNDKVLKSNSLCLKTTTLSATAKVGTNGKVTNDKTGNKKTTTKTSSTKKTTVKKASTTSKTNTFAEIYTSERSGVRDRKNWHGYRYRPCTCWLSS